MEKLVIVGCGRLANIVVDAYLKNLLPDYDLVGVFSRRIESAKQIQDKIKSQGKNCKICNSLEELLALNPTYLVEAASPKAMKELAIPTLKKGTSIITLSIGALADKAFYQEVIQKAKAYNGKVYPVSGATGGFDVLGTATLMGNATANFFNEKGPDGLSDTPIYDESLEKEKRIIFTGNAEEAIRLYPTKVNVAVAASLASVGPQNMKMKIQSTPGFIGDTQRVEIKNNQVHAVVNIYSATSDIAGWSVVNTLRNITSPIVF